MHSSEVVGAEGRAERSSGAREGGRVGPSVKETTVVPRRWSPGSSGARGGEGDADNRRGRSPRFLKWKRFWGLSGAAGDDTRAGRRSLC